MSATVHRLFPYPGSKPPPSSAAEKRPMAHPLIAALRDLAQPILGDQLRALFEGADDSLFAMSQRAVAGDEQRFAFDTMRLLRLERARIEREFDHAVQSSFESATPEETDEFDLDRLALQQTEELEEKIAVGNLSTKAETLHRDALRELGLRLQHLVRNLGVPVSRHALSPATVCNAFKASLRGLDLALSVRLLLYKLFDQYCASRLGELYQSAIRLLDAHGVTPLASPQAAAPKWSPYGVPTPPVEDGDLLELPALDRSTREALQDIGDRLGDFRPQDAAFAEELLGFTSIDALAHPTIGQVAPAQRMSLVGQMCNEILSDPHLPKAMRPLFERLRFPLIKIALADGSFFANRVHPVRRLVAEAAETAASSRVASPAVVKRLEERLRHIAEQIDLSATFVRPEVRRLLPLTMTEIASFLDQQRDESETRRENVLNKVRRTVAQELEVHTLGRRPPQALVSFLRLGWGPLMAARLLRHGMNSRPWIDAINRLVQILIGTDALEVNDDHRGMRQRLIDAVRADLGEIGMRDDKIEAAADCLRQAYDELDQRLAAMTPEDRERQDLQLLSPQETAAVMAEFPAPGSPQLRVPGAELLRPPMVPELRLDPPPEPQRLPDLVQSGKEPGEETAMQAPIERPPDSSIAASAKSHTPRIEEPVSPISSGGPEPVIAAAQATSAGSLAAPVIGDDTPDSELLALSLPAESWFRVFDRSRNQTLWLKVSRYYAEHGSVGFTGFDAKQALSIRDAQFIADLVSGRSEPVNASPVQLQAIAALRSRHH